MSFTRKESCTTDTPVSQEPTAPRPQTLLQRVSSGLSSMMPNIHSRRRASRTSTTDRSETAPISDQRLRNRTTLSQSQVLLRSQRPLESQIYIPKLSESDGNCPNEASTYYSFPSIEQKGCNFCSLRPSSGATTSGRPCVHCRSKSPFSHFTAAFKRSHGRGTDTSTVQSSLAQLIESSTPSEEGPRPVPDTIAAKRIGNPPRKSPLPGGHRPSYNTLRPNSSQQTRSQSDARPISPKLHHLHGLPRAKDSPFVHKREVDAHLAALRAGSPSPLHRGIDDSRTSADPREPDQDYSQTIFYGNATSSAPGLSSHRFGILSVSRTQLSATTVERVQAHGNIIIQEGRHGGIPTTLDLELQRSEVYRRHSPHPTPPPIRLPRLHEDESDTGFSTLTTQTPSTIGGKRLELKGGNKPPRLRGGNTASNTSLRLKLKKWLLTCHLPSDTNSDADLPPPRTPAPERILRTVRRTSGRARLPLKRCADTNPAARVLSSSTHQVIRCESPHPVFARLADSSIDIPTEQPGASLRGGSGGSSVRLPPTLFWFAGGRGESVTVGGWMKQKGRRRMGGLLGMAVYGAKAGTLYHGEGQGGGEAGCVRLYMNEVVGNGSVVSRAEVTGVKEVDGESGLVGAAEKIAVQGVGDGSGKAKGKERAIEANNEAEPVGNDGKTAEEIAKHALDEVVSKKPVVEDEGDVESSGAAQKEK